MTRPLRVAIVAANTAEFDSRLLRTASALAAAGHVVTVVGLAAEGLAEREELPGGVILVRVALDRSIGLAFAPLPAAARRALARALGFDAAALHLPHEGAAGLDRLRAPLRRLAEIVGHARRSGPWARAVLAAAPGTDVFHAKALIALPVIRAAARNAGGRFVYDIADIHTEAARLARMPRLVRALIRRRETGWMRGAAGLTTVNEALADEVVRRFGVARPVVLMNCPPRWHPDEHEPPASDRIRAATGIPADRPVILYQGGFSIDRGLEELVAALDEPPLRDRGAAVVLLGYGRLRAALLAEAERRPDRLFVLDAVPPSELLAWTASADVSFVGVPPRTLNQRMALPNKLFESLMAGVPVVVAEQTEHCRLVETEAVGSCCDVDSPAAIAAACAGLLAQSEAERRGMRRRARSAALERYNWEVQQAGVVELYGRLAAGKQ